MSTTTAAPNNKTPNYPKLTGPMLLAVLAVGFGLANGSIAVVDDSQKETYNSKIQAIKATDLQWLYLALVVLGRTIGLLNFVPVVYKNGIWRETSGPTPFSLKQSATTTKHPQWFFTSKMGPTATGPTDPSST